MFTVPQRKRFMHSIDLSSERVTTPALRPYSVIVPAVVIWALALWVAPCHPLSSDAANT